MAARLLVVDDEVDMLTLLGRILREKTPHEVVTTNNPTEALALVKGGGFDLVIADLKMPGMDGIELLDEVRKVDGRVPVIIITAYGTVEAAAECMEKGGFDFITKPFRKEQILVTVDRALKWVGLQRENRALREKMKAAGIE